MSLQNILFKRRFAVNFHGNLRLKMGEMSFYKDFVNDRRGDPYPLMGGTHYGAGSDSRFAGIAEETVGNGRYFLRAHRGSLGADANAISPPTGEIRQRAKRLMGGFFPWNIYEIDFSSLFDSAVGLALESGEGNVEILLKSNGKLTVHAEGQHFEFDVNIPRKSDQNIRTLTVAFRSDAMAVYLGKYGSGTEQICDLRLPTLNRLRNEKSLLKAHTYLLAEAGCGGEVCVDRVEWFLAAGLSQADLRAVKYENGEIMIRDGRIYLTASARLETGSYQVVLSLNPSLCDFRLEGVLLFNCGDGILCGDVASSIVYDRTESKWLIWMCMFSHGHYLGRTATFNCPLYGVNSIDVAPMEAATDGDSLTAFKGFRGDEDPDLIKIGDEWHLAVCRIDGGKYKYYHFVSKSPLDGFAYVDHTPGGEKTGGSFLFCHDGKVRFACGSDFSKRAIYDVYPIEDFTACGHLTCDFDDGGFRGWGSVMLLPIGTRRRYTWITFDRHNATKDNWSYGNIYVFDSEAFI